MDKNGLIMYFQYDSEGNVISMSFNGTRYYFVKNQQGDVEKIVNKQGVVVVTYKYDAWGNLCGITDTSGAWGIGKMNPFRYRSYIYDDETGLYYLQSRYYDPVTGRFLNADDISCIGSTGTALSSNVFAYCENNSANSLDYSGYNSCAIDASMVVTVVGSIVVGAGEITPVGWVITIGILTLVAASALVGYFQSQAKPKTKVKESTKTMTLEDTKAKLPKKKVYRLAYVNKSTGKLVKFGVKMGFVAALGLLGITGAKNSLTKKYKYDTHTTSKARKKCQDESGVKNVEWGIYAKKQSAAKALASTFKSSGPPEVHGSGKYGHYHDKTHSFHVWFGGKVKYYN